MLTNDQNVAQTVNKIPNVGNYLLFLASVSKRQAERGSDNYG